MRWASTKPQHAGSNSGSHVRGDEKFNNLSAPSKTVKLSGLLGFSWIVSPVWSVPWVCQLLPWHVGLACYWEQTTLKSALSVRIDQFMCWHSPCCQRSACETSLWSRVLQGPANLFHMYSVMYQLSRNKRVLCNLLIPSSPTGPVSQMGNVHAGITCWTDRVLQGLHTGIHVEIRLSVQLLSILLICQFLQGKCSCLNRACVLACVILVPESN